MKHAIYLLFHVAIFNIAEICYGLPTEIPTVATANSTFRVVTYNTGLTPRVGRYDVRRTKLGAAIRSIDADVICLQEVWFSSDMRSILNAVGGDRYPYSFSELHDTVGKMHTDYLPKAPCLNINFVTKFWKCMELKCRHTTGGLENLKCAQNECKMLQTMDQQCITCLVLSGRDSFIDSCVKNIGNTFNIPGLLLISKHPLGDVHMSRYVDKKLLIPRAYLTAKVDGLGTVACTHTTAHLGPDYFEVLPQYTSWAEQNLDEARTLVDVLSQDNRAVIMGDLNASPMVQWSKVEPDFQDALVFMEKRKFIPEYVRNVGICTWCIYNPLAHAHANMILDHVLMKNTKLAGVRRILDDNIPGLDFPLSDHFGIEVTVFVDEI